MKQQHLQRKKTNNDLTKPQAPYVRGTFCGRDSLPGSCGFACWKACRAEAACLSHTPSSNIAGQCQHTPHTHHKTTKQHPRVSCARLAFGARIFQMQGHTRVTLQAFDAPCMGKIEICGMLCPKPAGCVARAQCCLQQKRIKLAAVAGEIDLAPFVRHLVWAAGPGLFAFSLS